MLVHLPHLISIIVPVYNEARTVAAVIDRLLAIDLPAPREILVVNDGSTDGTREVLDRIAAAAGAAAIIHAAEERRQGQRDPDRLRAGRAARSSRSRMPTSSSIRRSSRSWCSRSSTAARGSSTDRASWRGGRRRRGCRLSPTGADRRHQRALRRPLTDMETCYKMMAARRARSRSTSKPNRFDIEPEITAKLLRAGHTHPRAAGALRAAQPRAGQEDRLARRRPRDRRSWSNTASAR